MLKRARFPALAGTVLAAASLLAACSESSTMPEATDEEEVTLQEMLEEAILDEFRAEAVYRGVLEDFGPVFPFANIVNAEVYHAAALANVMTNLGISVPANPYSPANVDHYGSVQEACQVGVVAEIENAAIYDRYLALDLPDAVRQVFQSNRDASMNAHLPAFQACS
jgi:hypothetical protein